MRKRKRRDIGKASKSIARIYVGYTIRFPDPEEEEHVLQVLGKHTPQTCNLPTEGVLIVGGVEFPVCGEMLETFGISPEQVLRDRREKFDQFDDGDLELTGEVDPTTMRLFSRKRG
jgi:hypothetical protein